MAEVDEKRGPPEEGWRVRVSKKRVVREMEGWGRREIKEKKVFILVTSFTSKS